VILEESLEENEFLHVTLGASLRANEERFSWMKTVSRREKEREIG